MLLSSVDLSNQELPSYVSLQEVDAYCTSLSLFDFILGKVEQVGVARECIAPDDSYLVVDEAECL